MELSFTFLGIILGVALTFIGWLVWRGIQSEILKPIDKLFEDVFVNETEIAYLKKMSKKHGDWLKEGLDRLEKAEDHVEVLDQSFDELAAVQCDEDGNLDKCMERTKLAIQNFIDLEKRLNDFEKQLEFMSSNAFLYYGVRARITQNGTGVHTATDRGATVVKTLKMDDQVTISEIKYHNGVAWAKIADNQWIHSGWEVVLK